MDMAGYLSSPSHPFQPRGLHGLESGGVDQYGWPQLKHVSYELITLQEGKTDAAGAGVRRSGRRKPTPFMPCRLWKIMCDETG